MQTLKALQMCKMLGGSPLPSLVREELSPQGSQGAVRP